MKERDTKFRLTEKKMEEYNVKNRNQDPTLQTMKELRLLSLVLNFLRGRAHTLSLRKIIRYKMI